MTLTPIQSFVFVPSWAQKMMLKTVMPDVVTADSAHCLKGTITACHGNAHQDLAHTSA